MPITAEGWEPGDLNPQDQWPADFESAASTNSARLPWHRCYATPSGARGSGIPALQPGTTGQAVHEAVAEVIREGGYSMGAPTSEKDEEWIGMRHGTGHGIGLDVNEPILLATGGGEILEREVFTVEPGLYSAIHGGVRVEDMVAVTATGHENFNQLHSELDWR